MKKNIINLNQHELVEFNHQLEQLTDVELSEFELGQSWSKIESALSSQTNSDKDQHAKQSKLVFSTSYFPFALAASVLLAVIVGFSQFDFSNKAITNTGEFKVENSTQRENSVTESPVRSSYVSVNELKQYNQLLEQRMRSLPTPTVLRANTMDTITRIEDRINLLDYRLALSEQQPLTQQEYFDIWQQRTQSMDSLYQVRAAQAQRASYQTNTHRPVVQRVSY